MKVIVVNDGVEGESEIIIDVNRKEYFLLMKITKLLNESSKGYQPPSLSIKKIDEKKLNCDRCKKKVLATNKLNDDRFYCPHCGCNLGVHIRRSKNGR